MGQDEDTQPLVWRADFCRREQARRRRVAHAPKLSQDGLKAEGDMPGDVFEKDPFWRALPDNPGDLGPEVAGVVGASTFPSGAEGLAGIPGQDGIERPTKGTGIETAKIIPDWRRSEMPGALGGDENGARPLIPLDEGAGVEAGFGEHDAQIKASAACAEGQSVPGT